MKARAELCQKVMKCLVKDGRMIHRHSMTFWHAPAKLPESRLSPESVSIEIQSRQRGHIPSHIGIKPKMKARAELCQKVMKCLVKDGRMIHRHSMTFWHAPAKLQNLA